MVNGDGPGPEEGTCEEGGASCERPEPNKPKHAIGEGAEDKGAEVAAATGASKEETGATAGKGCTIRTAGGWTGWALYASVRE